MFWAAAAVAVIGGYTSAGKVNATAAFITGNSDCAAESSSWYRELSFVSPVLGSTRVSFSVTVPAAPLASAGPPAASGSALRAWLYACWGELLATFVADSYASSTTTLVPELLVTDSSGFTWELDMIGVPLKWGARREKGEVPRRA